MSISLKSSKKKTKLMTSSRDDNVIKKLFHIAYNTRTTIVFMVSGRSSLYLFWLLSLPRSFFVSKSVYPAADLN